MDELIKILITVYLAIFFCFSASYFSTTRMVNFFLQNKKQEKQLTKKKEEKKNYLQTATESLIFQELQEILEFFKKVFELIEKILDII